MRKNESGGGLNRMGLNWMERVKRVKRVRRVVENKIRGDEMKWNEIK